MFHNRNIPALLLTDENFFIQGFPAPVTIEDWRRHHLQSFPAFINKSGKKVGDDVIQEAIESVYTMFLGVMDLWSAHEPQVYFDKTRLCYRLLICWYIVDMYPEYAGIIATTAGLPLKQRRIGPISISYNDKLLDSKDSLVALMSNAFGVKAHLMIKSAVARLRLRGTPPRILGRETEMGWFLQRVARGAEGQQFGPVAYNKGDDVYG